MNGGAAGAGRIDQTCDFGGGPGQVMASVLPGFCLRGLAPRNFPTVVARLERAALFFVEFMTRLQGNEWRLGFGRWHGSIRAKSV